jgi:hypothetical protein
MPAMFAAIIAVYFAPGALVAASATTEAWRAADTARPIEINWLQ